MHLKAQAKPPAIGRLVDDAIAGIDKPIGISTCELPRALPARLQSVLPTVEGIEAEMSPKRRKR